MITNKFSNLKKVNFKFNFFKGKGNGFKNSDTSSNSSILIIVKNVFWFVLGVVLGFFFFVSFLFIAYQKMHSELVYAGVYVDGHNFSEKKKIEVRNFFKNKNQEFDKFKIEFKGSTLSATISASQIDFGYDEELLSEQAFSIGRSDDQLANIGVIVQAYFDNIYLPRSFRHDVDKLDELLKPIQEEMRKEPENALFNFENGRVTAFTLAKDGQEMDIKRLKDEVYKILISSVDEGELRKNIKIDVPVKVVNPEITNENVNNLGINELIGEGTSLFAHSIENRIYNINLASRRLNGILVEPGGIFSVNKMLGDISTETGYKQAYVIENGRTVLGDGGGVCQVSTTLFRAALNAGLPIVERNPHAYRVYYYEQDSGPGIDAAVYSPTVDLKFKNDTGHHILVQSYVDNVNQKLTFDIYGTSDGRLTTINDPVILSQSPAPEPLYQDDPELPKGEVKQVDFAASGANVYFTRVVKRNGEVILDDKFTSNYRPWQAIYLRGTKE